MQNGKGESQSNSACTPETQETQQFSETQDPISQIEDEFDERKNSDHWGLLLQNKGKRLELSDPDAIYSVGSCSKCSIVLKGNNISRKHFIIKQDKGTRVSLPIIIDKSSNGTYVNGNKLKKDEERPLKQYDIITLLSPESEHQFRFLDLSQLKQNNKKNAEHDEILKSYTLIEDLGSHNRYI